MLLDICTDFGKEFEVDFGEEKCKIVFFTKSGDVEQKPIYTLQGKTLQEAEYYNYLGILISNGDNYVSEMQKKLVKKANKLKGAICHMATFAYNRYSVGRTVWKAVAIPGFTYSNDILTS